MCNATALLSFNTTATLQLILVKWYFYDIQLCSYYQSSYDFYHNNVSNEIVKTV